MKTKIAIVASAVIGAIMLFGEVESAEPVTAAESPAVQIVRMPELTENELIEKALMTMAHQIDNVKVSHYCICETCCGKSPDHPAYGITASGRKATPGVSVAVDPSIIPLGSTVMVDYGDGELVYYRADDTGSAVNGSHIDVCMESHQDAINAGIQTATIYWAEEER